MRSGPVSRRKSKLSRKRSNTYNNFRIRQHPLLCSRKSAMLGVGAICCTAVEPLPAGPVVTLYYLLTMIMQQVAEIMQRENISLEMVARQLDPAHIPVKKEKPDTPGMLAVFESVREEPDARQSIF